MADQNLHDFARTLEADDLPSEDLRWIAHSFGMDIAIGIADRFSGLGLYIPKRAMLHVKRLYARKHFNGANLRRLAAQLGVTEQTIRNWVQKPSQSHSAAPSSSVQMDLELDL